MFTTSGMHATGTGATMNGRGQVDGSSPFGTRGAPPQQPAAGGTRYGAQQHAGDPSQAALHRLVETLQRQNAEKDNEIARLEHTLLDREDVSFVGKFGTRMSSDTGTDDRTSAGDDTLSQNASASRVRDQTSEVRREHWLKVQGGNLVSFKEALERKEQENALLLKKLKDAEEAIRLNEIESDDRVQGHVKEALMTREKEHSTELTTLLNRQGVSMLGFAHRHLQSGEQDIETLQWELQRKERVLTSLQEEMRRSKEEVFKLKEENEALSHRMSELESGQLVAARQHKADAEARVSLNAAELHIKTLQNESLLQQVAEVEELLRQKDDEIRSVRRQLADKEVPLLSLQRELTAARYELEFKEMSLTDSETAAASRVESLTAMLRKQQDEHTAALRLQSDNVERMLEEPREEVQILVGHLRQLEEQLELKALEVQDANAFVEDKERKIADLREQLLELEGRLYANDRTVEVEYLKKGERDMKRRLEEQALNIEVLQQDSAILQKTRAENSDLQRQITELRTKLRSFTPQYSASSSSSSLAQLPLDPSVMPTVGPLFASAASRLSATVTPSYKFSSVHSQAAPSLGEIAAEHHTNQGGRGIVSRGIVGAQRSLRLEATRSDVTTSSRGVFNADTAAAVSGRGQLSSGGIPSIGAFPFIINEAHSAAPPTTIDQKLLDFLAGLSPRRRLRVVKNSDGSFVLGTRRTFLKCVNGLLMAQAGNSFLTLSDFIEAELSKDGAGPA